jgi:hypothetical protein
MDDQLMQEFYQAFKDAEPEFIANGLEPVRTIDRYRGQPSNPKDFEYYPLPAVFFSWKIRWQKVGQVYNGMMSLSLHVELENTGETANIYEESENGLKYLRHIKQIRKVMDNFSSERLSTPLRTEDSDLDTGVTVYDVLGYEAQYYEDEDQGKYQEGEIEEVDVQGSFVKRMR